MSFSVPTAAWRAGGRGQFGSRGFFDAACLAGRRWSALGWMTARPPRAGRFRATTCRRWGDASVLTRVARSEASQHYYSRVACRAKRDRQLASPLVHSRQPTEACGPPSLTLTSLSQVEHVGWASAPLSPAPLPSHASLARASGVLPVGSSLIAKAEARAALGYYADFTDGGRVPVRRAVDRFPWSSPHRAEHAASLARALDLLPRAHCPPAWSATICTLAAVMFEELCPAFERVRRVATEHGFFFSGVPLRGRCGWRARARWAGLLGSGAGVPK